MKLCNISVAGETHLALVTSKVQAAIKHIAHLRRRGPGIG